MSIIKTIKELYAAAATMGGIKSVGDFGAISSLGFEKLAGSIHLSTTALGTFLGVAATIGTVALVIDLLVESFDEAKEKADESRAAYEQTKSEIESMNSELESTQSKIDELKSKGSLTLVEQQELTRLENENAQLERQIALKEKLAQYQGSKAAADAENTLTNKGFTQWESGDGYENSVWNDFKYSSEPGTSVDIIDYTYGKQKRLNDLQEEYNELLKEQLKYEPDSSEYKNIERRKNTINKEMTDLQEDISSNMDIISENLSSLYDETGNVRKGYEDVVGRANELSNFIVGDTEELQNQLSITESVLNRPSLQKYVDAAKEYAQEMNGITLENSSTVPYFNTLKMAVIAAGGSVEDLIALLNQLAGTINEDEVRSQIKGAFYINDIDTDDPNEEKFMQKRQEEFNNWVNGLSIEDLKIVYGIYADNDTSAWTFADWKQALENAKEEADSAGDSLDKFMSKSSMAKPISEAKKYAAELNGITVDDIITQFPELSRAAQDAGIDLQEVCDGINESVLGIDFDTVKENVDGVKDSISSVQEVLSGQKTGESISIDDFNSDELKDYTSALEYNNGALQLNAEKVSEIVQAKTEEQIAINNANKALAQSKYLENADDIETLRQKLKDGNYEYGETEESIRSTISARLEENEALLNEIHGYDLMTASLQEATDAYHNWLNAQNASESGDMFDDTLEAMNLINDTLNNKDSDSYGRVGREDYKAALGLIVPDSVDSSDKSAVNSYLDSIHNMFTYDDDGNWAGLNIENFCKEAMDAGLMYFDEAQDSYMIAGEKTMEDFADGLGLALPLVQAMFGEMEEFGGEFSWADEANKTIGDLAVTANEAAESLRTINPDLEIKLDVSDLDTAEEKTSALDDTIKQMQDYKATVDVDSSEAEYANSIIEYCVTQKQLLSQPDVMSVDTSLVEGKVGEAIALLQEFQQAKDALELKQSLGVDTTEAQANLDAVTQKIQGLDTNVTATLGIDTTSIDTISSTIEGLTPEMMVKAGIDETAIIGYQSAEHNANGEVIWSNDTAAVDKYSVAKKSATGKVKWYNDTTLVKTTFTATGTINWKGEHDLNGTAHASGTANAGGNWGTAQGGTTLVGELGKEIVVNPRTGKWYTVGDKGAEFVNIPRGSIVFNHKQTEELLKNGFVAGRASALVGGTAMVTGGIPTSGAKASTVSGGNSTSNYKSSTSSSSSKSSSSKSSSSSSSSTSAEEELQKVDWIEIAIDRIERAIDRLKNTVSSAYKTLKEKLSASADAITKVNEEISLQTQARDRYLQEAENVGLSPELAEMVKNGAIDISEYDEETQGLISDFQEWYEKSLDCSEAIETLHESLAELYEDNFNNIQEDFENQLGLLEHLTNTYNTGIDALEAKGYLASTQYYAALQNVEKQNIDVMEKELEDLTAAFSEAMASGEIEEGSDAWYTFQESINGVKESIAEANVNLLEFAKTMREIEWSYFDYMQDRIGQINQESNFLIDLMSNKQLHGDKGQLTNYGLATAGLHAQNYNVYMAQADKYADEILKIDEELAKDPYNTDLIERREELLGLQQEAILAAEGEKDALVELVRDGIQLELDSLKDLIDTYKDSLDSAKDLYEYQKKIADKTSDIAALQKQLSAYENDVSEETRAQVQKLQVDLAKAEEDLAETEYEKFISDTKSMLDNLYTEYEQVLNERLDNVDALLQDIADMVNANATTIGMAVGDGVGNISEYLSGNTQSINETLHQVTDDVGYTMTKEMQDIWSSEQAVVTMYGDGYTTQLTSINSVLSRIEANTAAMAANSNAEAQTVIKTTTSTTTPVTPSTPAKTETPKTVDTSKNTTQTTPTLDNATKHGVAAAIWNGNYGWGTGTTRANRLTEVFGANNGIQAIVNTKADINGNPKGYSYTEMRKKFKGYKTGGIVDYTGLAQLDGTPGKPELVLNPEDTKNFLALRDTLRVMSQQEFGIGSPKYNVGTTSLSGLTDISSILAGLSKPFVETNSTGGDVKIEINIDHVQDYNDFVTQLQKDKQFEKMVRAMSTDQLFGASPLAKNKYRWNNK